VNLFADRAVDGFQFPKRNRFLQLLEGVVKRDITVIITPTKSRERAARFLGDPADNNATSLMLLARVKENSEIYGLFDELVREGIAILVISSDLPEVLALADRILIMRHGTDRRTCPARHDGRKSDASRDPRNFRVGSHLVHICIRLSSCNIRAKSRLSTVNALLPKAVPVEVCAPLKSDRWSPVASKRNVANRNVTRSALQGSINVKWPQRVTSQFLPAAWRAPGGRRTPPWAEVYYAFGVPPRCYLLKMPLKLCF
jgi:hypothetical protein